MKKVKGLFFLAFIIWAAMFIMTACGGGTDENGEPTPTAPGAPTIEDVYAENRELVILWDAVSNANTYSLYWNTTGGVTTSDSSVTNLRIPYYIHSGLSLFKTYSYAVSAMNAGGESALSNEVSALPVNIPQELWKRLAPLPADSDIFGFSSSISGDYVVVGVPNKDDGGGNSGAAYVFGRDEGGTDMWGQAAILTASDAQAGDSFGFSVAISGDYVVVGAPYEDGGGGSSGAAYVFGRNEGGTDMWGEVTKLTASDAAAGDQFGFSVAISGDYVVVGAHYKDDALLTDCGAAYVFGKDEGGPDLWGEAEILTASDAADADQFGCSVAISGDYVVVGARGYEDVGGTNLGAAYIFDRNDGGPDIWGEVEKLTASDAADGDEFGFSVAIDGDYVIVGAHYEDGEGTSRGAAYIYGRNYGVADSWGEVMKLTASSPEDQAWFGYSVAINGDNAVVGAPFEDGEGTNRGAVYIF